MAIKQLLSGCALVCAYAGPAAAAEGGDLSALSIEQLAQIEVRSASKREEPLSAAPTALYVITNSDIVASGVTSLPEALRLAPNLQVQQVDASEYAISARGFNGTETANKLLVLIDGRTIYTPLASSVFWNLHSPLLEDIQQIEVISGPGGTLYGPNAVNGVVNVTSKPAQETIGTMIRGTAGGEEQSAALRHGFVLGGAGAVRVYGNWLSRDALPSRFGNVSDDDYRGWQAGFRGDIVTDADHVTVQGDLFRNKSDVVDGDGANGHNLLARWARTLNESSSLQVQAYYDRFEREFILVEDSLSTIDGEAQLNITAGAHELVAGGGVRTTRDRFINNLNPFRLDPSSRRLWVYNAFIQDRFALSPDLSVTAGIKVERSTFTGWQILPNLRLAWQPNAQAMVWGAVSRAVRTPSRIDRELVFLPILAQSIDFQSEKLIAVEAGYRGQPFEGLGLSVSGFVNFYDDIRTTEATPVTFLPIRLDNGIKGRTYGIEAWGNVQVTAWWRLSLGATTLWKDFHIKEGHNDLADLASTGADPNYQLTAGSQLQLGPRLQLTLNGRAVDGLDRGLDTDSYVELGGRVAYQLNRRLELFAAGRNLLHRTHAENNDPDQAQLAKRSLYLGARARF